MKANQKFLQANEAVSPVIGVILMVAITVVLSAVVFVLVSDLGDTGNAPEQAAVEVESTSEGFIDVLLVRGGDNAPYGADDVLVTVNGASCDSTDAAVTIPSDWAAGQTVKIDGDIISACGNAFSNGDEQVQVVVTILGTVVFNGPVDVTSTVNVNGAVVTATSPAASTLRLTLSTAGAAAPYDFSAGEFGVTVNGVTCVGGDFTAGTANAWADGADLDITSLVASTNCLDEVFDATNGAAVPVVVTILEETAFSGSVSIIEGAGVTITGASGAAYAGIVELQLTAPGANAPYSHAAGDYVVTVDGVTCTSAELGWFGPNQHNWAGGASIGVGSNGSGGPCQVALYDNDNTGGGGNIDVTVSIFGETIISANVQP